MDKKKANEQDVVIIGAGASGIMAAITAARRGLSVTVLEHMEKPAKKLLATGNGKCNFTNLAMTPDCFYGDRTLVQTVLHTFSAQDTLSFFREIGIWPKEKNGYVYPNSGQAVSVVEALLCELHRTHVTLVTACEVTQIKPNRAGFLIQTSKGTYKSRSLIAATGLLASPKSGSDGSLFPLLKTCGHRFSPILPALCGFEATGMEFKKVSGVRADACLSLYIENKCSVQERGELQLADYGISGIPVFQISSPAVRALYQKKSVVVAIDFLADISTEALEQELTRRFARDAGQRTAAESLCGLLHQKLIPVLLRSASISVSADAGQITAEQKRQLVNQIKQYPVTLKKARDFSFAQVCAGGIHTEEIHTDTLESRLVPGLYFTGELLDVDGICGGYNLQWAWSSGYTAGSRAGL